MKVNELLKEESSSIDDLIIKAMEASMDASSTFSNLEITEDEIFFTVHYDFPEGRIGKSKDVRAVLKGVAKVNAQNGGGAYDAGTDYQILLKTELESTAKLEAAIKAKFKGDIH